MATRTKRGAGEIMAFLDKHQVALFDDLKSKDVDIWGGQVRIRVMSVKEQQEFNNFLENKPEDKAINFFLIKNCCLNEDGSKFFNDNDDEILDNKSLTSINFLVNEILSLSKQQPSDVESLAKNS